MQAALESLRDGTCGTGKEAAEKFGVNAKTLSDRKTGKHVSHAVASKHCRLLNSSQDKVLTEYVEQAAAEARPYDRQYLRSLAHDISGVVPGKNWDY
ncbi:hypothetical protein BDQ17DRAFT_1539072 [Cyathus striatus]|nr:hypothetical protein BDQ17DRAFT_1539072 [Cyathus striatus]